MVSERSVGARCEMVVEVRSAWEGRGRRSLCWDAMRDMREGALAALWAVVSKVSGWEIMMLQASLVVRTLKRILNAYS